MRITLVEMPQLVRVSDIQRNLEISRKNLEKIAQQHNVSIETLIDQAKEAGDAAAPWQVRALNLAYRIEKLEGRL